MPADTIYGFQSCNTCQFWERASRKLLSLSHEQRRPSFNCSALIKSVCGSKKLTGLLPTPLPAVKRLQPFVTFGYALMPMKS